MAIDMLVFDRRVAGYPGNWADAQLEVTESTPISQIISLAVTTSRAKTGINRLLIVAHGMSGYGVALGKEGLTSQTLVRFAPLKGHVKRIILLSCSAAKVAGGRAGRVGDGDLLMRRLAKATSCEVVASDTNQEYSLGSRVYHQPIMFGRWEGNVYLYSPSGERRLFGPNEDPCGLGPPPAVVLDQWCWYPRLGG